MRRLGALLALTVTVGAGAAGCAGLPDTRDPLESAADRDVGRPALAFLWRQVITDRAQDHRPQEFGSPVVGGFGRSPDRRVVFAGSSAGMLVAMRARDGKVLWSTKVGPVGSEPIFDGRTVYVGTDDGALVALEAGSGKVRWRYETRGAVLRAPVIARGCATR